MMSVTPIFKHDVPLHLLMPATTGCRYDTASVQSGNKWMNTKIYALNAPVEWHTDLILKRIRASR